MSNADSPPRDRTRRKPNNHAEVAEARTALVKKIVQAESAALDARTAKLRALRLAKEEADREDAAASVKPPKKRRVRG